MRDPTTSSDVLQKSFLESIPGSFKETCWTKFEEGREDEQNCDTDFRSSEMPPLPN